VTTHQTVPVSFFTFFAFSAFFFNLDFHRSLTVFGTAANQLHQFFCANSHIESFQGGLY